MREEGWIGKPFHPLNFVSPTLLYLEFKTIQMKIRLIILSTFLVAAVALMPSCKKNRIVKNETGQVSEDNSNIQAGMDGAVDDGTKAMSDNSAISGRLDGTVAALIAPCGYTVDTTQRPLGILTLNFDGTTACNGRIRAGSIKLTLQDYTLGKRWKDAGAVVRMDFTNYKVTRASDSKSITFNGTANMTNVSGGNVVLMVLGFQQNVVHKVESSNSTALFDDGKTSTFNLSRQYTHTYSNNVYQVKGEGVGTHNSLSNIENWGTTRDGDEFTSQVTQAVIWNSSCGAGKPVSGKLDIKVASKQFSLITTLGVDNAGNISTATCPWGMKVEWTYKNKTGSKLYAYH
jgi:hypothetical protein